ncbi:MAG: RnfABCDGE type electron transport complex subunit D [Pseudaminobacter sp.]
MDVRVEFPQAALSAAGRRVPQGWTSDRVTTVFTLAAMFPLAAAIHATGGALLPHLLGTLFVSIGWTYLFGRLRSRDMNWHAVPVAIVFTLMVPAVPLWQSLVALSFGIVVGEQIFGGRGYSFLSPAVAALAFLFFSFPTAAGEQAPAALVTIAVLPGALLLIASGLISWRIVIAVAIGFTGWIALKGFGLPSLAMLTTSLALGVTFLICEPTSAAATNPGRWAYGLFTGALLVILGDAGQGVGSTASIVFAALLGSVFAPLIDRIVIHFNIRRRRQRRWPG